MAAKILANLIVMGSGILARAFVQAYRQALANASKSGVAQETIQNTIRKGSKVMTEQEARQILGVTEETAWEEIVKKYDTLFERNAKNGSFYLQSKVHRAKECLEAVHRGKGEGTPS
ncbi:hypothetical protein JCGZ_23812 [Jatropha curcas]|uniref:Uncharacterized protein n=1 Tax=Jatropha curcas TaxID=180498 RepID=A0A067LED2_JATCU|nr:mitochondrial import inner membrane translocase subunit PAM16 like 2 [Jatropha curcas]KDP42870.1 hypothetical protein JCGZ_23812 [Jatropha curcas]